jgi:hypothetical protein
LRFSRPVNQFTLWCTGTQVDRYLSGLGGSGHIDNSSNYYL